VPAPGTSQSACGIPRAAVSALVALGLLTAGCAARETLEPRSPHAPAAVDLSGNWQLTGDYAASRREIDRAVRATDGIDERMLMQQIRSGSSRRSGNTGGVAHLFLEYAPDIKITQAPHALFISFGRSVVEEYRFGELRMARIGEATAQRSSGWDGDDYVVETLDQERMKVTERYHLLPGGDRLERRLTFRSRALAEVTVDQVFERSANP